MTRPLNQDGTAPLKRRVQLVMQVVEGSSVLHEVVRNIKPVWMEEMGETPVGATAVELAGIDVEEQVLLAVGTAMSEVAGELAPEMTRELFLWMKQHLK